jgi:hypothetical protein
VAFILDILSAIPPYAYSLRSLTTTYTGPLVTVKRASDGTSQSFSAVDGVVTEEVLAAFCNGSAGTYTEWFNQGSAGANGDLTVASPGVFPSATISSGNIATQNGLPALFFPGPATSNAGFVSGTTFAVWSAATSANFVFAETSQSNFGAPLLGGSAATLDTAVVWAGFADNSGGTEPTVLCAGNDTKSFGTPVPINVPNILTFSAPALSGGDLTVSGWLNSATMGTASVTNVTGTAPTGFSLTLDIFQESNTAFQGTMTEIVLWNSVVSTADRTKLETNQALFYGVAGFAVASAAGTGTASAVSQSLAVGAASGVGAAVGAGALRQSAVATASGVAVALGTGAGQVLAAGAAAGSSQVSAIGAGVIAGIGDATGVGDATGIGVASIASIASSAGQGSAVAIGAGAFPAVASSVGIGVADGDGTAVSNGAGSAAGIGSAQGQSSNGEVVTGVGEAQGSSDANSIGQAIVAATGQAAGTGTATGSGAGQVVATGAASGIAGASAVAVATFEGTANAAGIGSANALAATAQRGAGNAAGTSSVNGIGAAPQLAVAAASGAGEANGFITALFQAIAASQGIGIAQGAGNALYQAIGQANGLGAALGVPQIDFIIDPGDLLVLPRESTTLILRNRPF